jgi:hypothetical protein
MPKSRVGKGQRTDATGRSRGERYVRLEYWMARSDAFRKLDGNALKILIDISLRFNGENNGDIGYSVREAEGVGLGKTVAARAMKSLADRGFIVATRQGSFHQKRLSRTWRLTWLYTGPADAPTAQATKEFMSLAGAENSEHSPASGTHSPSSGTIGEIATPESTLTVPSAGLCGTDTPSLQSRQRDTSNLPGGTPVKAKKPECSKRDRAASPPTEQRGPVPRVGHNDELDRRVTVRLRNLTDTDPSSDHQIDLEEAIAVADNPPRSLRADLDAWLKRQPRGAVNDLAKELHLSSATISNFRAGRYPINPMAAKLLRQIIQEDTINA